MKDFSSFYEKSLLPVLIELEGERKQITSAIIKFGLLGVAGLILGTWLSSNVLVGILALVAAGIAFYIKYWQKIQDFKIRFKDQVVRKMVKYIDESLEYSPSRGIPSGEYHQSKIFVEQVDRYHCEDMVSGTLGKTAIRFSEVHSQKKEQRRSSNGQTTTHWKTIFRGILFVGDFNKNFNGRTVVLPDTAESWFGSIGTMFQKMNTMRDELIKLEDPEFEKAFAVYGTDQVEARYILSTSLMQRIMEFRQKTGSLHLSFINSQVFIAIPVSKNLFEANLMKTLLDFKGLNMYYNYLVLSTGIVEDLNLNTRIWTKE